MPGRGFVDFLAIATLGLSWNFRSAKNLESLSLQDRPMQDELKYSKWNISATNYWIILK
jgi:hypothetical protein